MSAVAVFKTLTIQGDVVFTQTPKGVRVNAFFVRLPSGDHGFHIHKAGDLRGKGCKGACDHFHIGEPSNHGGPPGTRGDRHTGDLGNISCDKGPCKVSYWLPGLILDDLYGRSVIIHADPDDYGRGGHPDSLTTGDAGARLACAVIGRI
jgi:Cu-Zn family superoxide dismutase